MLVYLLELDKCGTYEREGRLYIHERIGNRNRENVMLVGIPGRQREDVVISISRRSHEPIVWKNERVECVKTGVNCKYCTV